MVYPSMVMMNYPPEMINMRMANNPHIVPKYDSLGQPVPPITQLDFNSLTENIQQLSMYQKQQYVHIESFNKAIREHVEYLERKMEDALALMHYTVKYYPHVLDEFRTAERAKERIGVVP